MGATIVYLICFLAPILAKDEGFVLPKSYSSLRIPSSRRFVSRPPVLHDASSGFRFHAGDQSLNETVGQDEIETSGHKGLKYPGAVVPYDDATFSPRDAVFSPQDDATLSPQDRASFSPQDEEESLFPQYDEKSPPWSPSQDEDQNEESGPIDVDVAMQIQSIRQIDEAEQKITIEIDLTVHWTDYQCIPENENYLPEKVENVTELLQTFDGKPLHASEFEKLWKPDIFIERVVKIKKPILISSPETVTYIKHTSSMVYTTRASVTVDCSMNFKYYPADTQNCTVNIRSFQYDNSKMRLRWNPEPGAYLVDTDSDDNFDLKLTYVAQRTKKVKSIKHIDTEFDVLQIKLSMRRKMTYHLLQTYIPSAFLVFITWLSFLIPEDLIEARIGISMTTLLTLTAMFSAVRESTPVVSYIKAIDIWMVYCIFIVFGTLLEFTFFVWLRKYKIAQREKQLTNLMCGNMPKNSSGMSERTNSVALQTIDEIATKAAQTFQRTAKLLNKFAFGFFVLNFVVFCSAYWLWLILCSGHSKWKVNPTFNAPKDDNEGFSDEL